MNAVKHSGCLGVPARRLAVALSAASPRADYRAVGFPLQSLTRNAASDSLEHIGQKSPSTVLYPIDTSQPIDQRGREGLLQSISSVISTPLDQDPVAAVGSALIDFFSTSTLLRSGSHRRLAPLLRKGVRLFDGSALSRAFVEEHLPLRGGVLRQGIMGSPLWGEPMNGRLTESSNRGQTLVKHLGNFV